MKYSASIPSSSMDVINGSSLRAYTMSYLPKSYFTITDINIGETNFTVSAKLFNSSDTIVGGASVSCLVNDDLEYDAYTDISTGVVSFTVPFIDDVTHYRVLLSYDGLSNLSGCFICIEISVNEAETIILYGNNEGYMIAKVLDSDGEPVKDAVVTFYQTGLLLFTDKRRLDVFQEESANLTCVVLDEDGEPVSGETVKFYKNSVDVENLIGTETSDSDGECSCTYTPVSVDDDIVLAWSASTDISNIIDFRLINVETLDKTVSLVFNGDDDNADGNRPSRVDVNLKAGDTILDSVYLDESTMSYTWEDLEKYSGDEEITYSITIDDVEDFTDYDVSIRSVQDGWEIVFDYDPEMMTVGVKILWDDDGDSHAVRPNRVMATLKDGNTNIQAIPVLYQTDYDSLMSVPVNRNGVAASYDWTLETISHYEVYDKTASDNITTFTLKYFNSPGPVL